MTDKKEILTVDQNQVEQIVSPDLPKIVEFSKTHEIKDDDSFQEAIEFAVIVKRAEKFYKFEKTKILTPFENALKAMKASFTSKVNVVEAAGAKNTLQIGAWNKKIREEEEEAEKLRRANEEKEAAAKLAKAKRTAELFGDSKSQHDLKKAEKQAEIVECTTQSEIVAKKPDIRRTATGGSVSVRKTWKFEVTDLAALMEGRPDLVTVEANSKVINALIAGENGEREIKGLKIYCDESYAVRT